MTLRDAAKYERDRLDSVRNSKGSDRITRPIDLRRRWTYVTNIRLQKGYLVWKQAPPKPIGNHWVFDGEVAREAIVARHHAEQGGRGILDEFILLCDSDDEAIVKYARSWGVLELCTHNLPSCHEFSLGAPLSLPLPTPKLSTGIRQWFHEDPRQCTPTGREALATWRLFSGQARALLNIAADLQKACPGSREDWSKLLKDRFSPAESLGAHRSCLLDAIEAWLKLGRIKPTIDDLTTGLTWTGADLFGEIAVQIALAAKAMDGQVLCVACGKEYQPKRLVIRRGFNYCPKIKCQREAAAARAKRYRDRKKSPEGERGSGLPYRCIYGGTTNDPLFSR
ncbi:MAG: hypothetical protein IT364_04005 [Candidatus Hydrogenedentes bacterium]|nr:hypothetical protein [Candidatus Hydrogenedentota bacterium]MCZ2154335.1 hypothetical protein [Bryobacterales bacterium]